jgi:hypothetical protein
MAVTAMRYSPTGLHASGSPRKKMKEGLLREFANSSSALFRNHNMLPLL